MSRSLATKSIKVYSSGPWEGPLRSDTLPLLLTFARRPYRDVCLQVA